MNRYFFIGKTEKDINNKMSWWVAKSFSDAEQVCLQHYPDMKILSITDGGPITESGAEHFNPFDKK